MEASFFDFSLMSQGDDVEFSSCTRLQKTIYGLSPRISLFQISLVLRSLSVLCVDEIWRESIFGGFVF